MNDSISLRLKVPVHECSPSIHSNMPVTKKESEPSPISRYASSIASTNPKRREGVFAQERLLDPIVPAIFEPGRIHDSLLTQIYSRAAPAATMSIHCSTNRRREGVRPKLPAASC